MVEEVVDVWSLIFHLKQPTIKANTWCYCRLSYSLKRRIVTKYAFSQVCFHGNKIQYDVTILCEWSVHLSLYMLAIQLHMLSVLPPQLLTRVDCQSFIWSQMILQIIRKNGQLLGNT